MAIQTRIHELSHYLVKRSQRIIGGDGAYYVIGYGGLDYTFASIFSLTSEIELLQFRMCCYLGVEGMVSNVCMEYRQPTITQYV